MKRLYLIGLALSAVIAFGAIAASSAFAVGPEWLVEEAQVVEALPSEIASEDVVNGVDEGDLLLIKLISSTNSGVLTEILCSGYLVGSIGPGAADEITGALNLAQEAIGKESNGGTLEGLALECEVTFDEGALTDCKVGANAALVWPFGLPWLTELELMEIGGKVVVLDRIFKDATDSNTEPPGYDVECESLLGVLGSELCSGNTSALLTNDLNTLMGVLSEFNEESEPGNCTLTGEKTAFLLGKGTTYAVGGTVAAPKYLERLDTLVDHV